MMQSFTGHAGDVMSLDLSPAESGSTFASGVSNTKIIIKRVLLAATQSWSSHICMRPPFVEYAIWSSLNFFVNCM